MSVLYVASNQPRAGKTAVSVTLARKLSQDGKQVALFKPLTSEGAQPDPDAQVLRQATGSQGDAAGEWPVSVSPEQTLQGATLDRALETSRQVGSGADVTIVEGLSGLRDAAGANSQALAERLDAQVIAVLGYASGAVADEAARAKDLFGDRLAGVIINGVTRYKMREVESNLAPKLEADGIKVLASIPEDRRLLGMSVEQLAQHLDGRILSWEEKKDNFVEHFLIGGLVLDWGVLYFERFENKAVIVRGDKPDIQMAALGTPTSCIVLTAGQPPIQYVQYEAGQEEVPLIQVDTDTIATAEALESLQEKAIFDHPLKQGQFMELMSRHGSWDAVYQSLGI